MTKKEMKKKRGRRCCEMCVRESAANAGRGESWRMREMANESTKMRRRMKMMTTTTMMMKMMTMMTTTTQRGPM